MPNVARNVTLTHIHSFMVYWKLGGQILYMYMSINLRRDGIHTHTHTHTHMYTHKYTRAYTHRNQQELTYQLG